ncbi:YkuS family protein [Alkaliphilus peptidifermentans]|uniref:Uncharacterized protein family (UPF0180) n=1 Tax=Alkaliphilus peptidifermentans DSM 18978 TaxID=1120976 RepID=A0A1G5HH24_9FIRM|nr:YkuS family protein [Alkaliphilus peptidifermentans]SCY62600.1 Uncharacterised protein family (UPF0180) [Alkaliphilus peptidifermentans DSM 18978]
MKKIAVEEGLKQVKDELKARGYEIIDFNKGGSVDAIVYSNDYSGIEAFNNEAGIQDYGAMLINANNKTIEEIVYMIEKRRYGGLFT